METEWKIVTKIEKLDKFICPSCKTESRVRKATKKKVCKACGSIFER